MGLACGWEHEGSRILRGQSCTFPTNWHADLAKKKKQEEQAVGHFAVGTRGQIKRRRGDKQKNREMPCSSGQTNNFKELQSIIKLSPLYFYHNLPLSDNFRSDYSMSTKKLQKRSKNQQKQLKAAAARPRPVSAPPRLTKVHVYFMWQNMFSFLGVIFM